MMALARLDFNDLLLSPKDVKTLKRVIAKGE
jgi:hypothetical protein